MFEAAEAFGDVIREECIHHIFLHRLELWRRQGVVSESRDLRVEQRRGIVVSWSCEVADDADAAMALLIEVQDFAERACGELALPEATIWWWFAERGVAQVRVAFSLLPFDA